MEAEIILVYDYPDEAGAIADAVSPDNIKVPPDLSIKTVRSKRMVITRINCKEYKFGTFISTIDDLLSCVSVAEKTLSSVKRLT